MRIRYSDNTVNIKAVRAVRKHHVDLKAGDVYKLAESCGSFLRGTWVKIFVWHTSHSIKYIADMNSGVLAATGSEGIKVWINPPELNITVEP